MWEGISIVFMVVLDSFKLNSFGLRYNWDFLLAAFLVIQCYGDFYYQWLVFCTIVVIWEVVHNYDFFAYFNDFLISNFGVLGIITNVILIHKSFFFFRMLECWLDVVHYNLVQVMNTKFWGNLFACTIVRIGLTVWQFFLYL